MATDRQRLRTALAHRDRIQSGTENHVALRGDGQARPSIPSPRDGELPKYEPQEFHRVMDLGPQPYRPTLWTPRHSSRKAGNRTTADRVVETRTKVKGKAPAGKGRQGSRKAKVKRGKAQAWMAKNGHWV